MINAIQNEFDFLNNSSHIGEVVLFRNMASAIEKHTSSVYVQETHGSSKANVVFTSPRKYADRCEISDQLIVSFSKSKRVAKATFFQAKYSYPTNGSKLLLKTQMDFRGQTNQWFLLHSRPFLTGVPNFNPPNDLLSGFVNPAIGSYGVYYQSTNEFELTYSVGVLVSCASPNTARPKLAINRALNGYSIFNSVAVTNNLDGFLRNLFDFRIGADIDPASASGDWILNYVKARAISAGAEENVLEAINNVALDTPIYGDIPDSESVGLSVLIVLTA